jgi:hypothetical protein
MNEAHDVRPKDLPGVDNYQRDCAAAMYADAKRMVETAALMMDRALTVRVMLAKQRAAEQSR